MRIAVFPVGPQPGTADAVAPEPQRSAPDTEFRDTMEALGKVRDARDAQPAGTSQAGTASRQEARELQDSPDTQASPESADAAREDGKGSQIERDGEEEGNGPADPSDDQDADRTTDGQIQPAPAGLLERLFLLSSNPEQDVSAVTSKAIRLWSEATSSTAIAVSGPDSAKSVPEPVLEGATVKSVVEQEIISALGVTDIGSLSDDGMSLESGAPPTLPEPDAVSEALLRVVPAADSPIDAGDERPLPTTRDSGGAAAAVAAVQSDNVTAVATVAQVAALQAAAQLGPLAPGRSAVQVDQATVLSAVEPAEPDDSQPREAGRSSAPSAGREDPRPVLSAPKVVAVPDKSTVFAPLGQEDAAVRSAGPDPAPAPVSGPDTGSGLSGLGPGGAPASNPATPHGLQVHAHSVARQMAEATRHRTDGSVELKLSPEELGPLRMTIVTSGDGITVMVRAERSETSDLLRRNIDTLAQEFRDIGYSSISFSFAERQEQAPQPQDGSVEPRETSTTHPLAQLSAFVPSTRGAGTGLDLRL